MKKFLSHVFLVFGVSLPVLWVISFCAASLVLPKFDFVELKSNDVLIGDSHAENLIWKNGDAFILPGSGLFHPYLVLRELADANENDLGGMNIYITIWPGSFSGIQEGRFNGNFQDGWVSNIGGRCAMLFRWEDWINPVIPAHIKIEILKGTLHFDFQTTYRYENSCVTKVNDDPNRYSVPSEHFTAEAFKKATFSKWCFLQIQDLALKSNANLTWLETPVFRSFFSKKEFMNEYETFLHQHQDRLIKRIDAKSFLSDVRTGFIDYHHFNCDIAYPLDSLLIQPNRSVLNTR